MTLSNNGTISGTTGTLTSTGTFEMQYGTVTAKLGGTNIPLNKTTANTVTMSGANTYTGTTTVSAGTLAYGASNAIYTGAVTVNGGTLSLGAYSDTVGTVTLLSGSITGSGTLTGTSYAVESGTISAVLGGGVGLTKSNTGTVTLSGANTYTGGTTVSGGTLALGGNNRLYTGGSITVSGSGVLDLGGYSQSTSGAVSFQGGTVQNGTLSKSGAAYDAQSGTVSANLAGGVGLTKTTAGTLTLSGANTYTGTTTVSAGTLAYGASNAIYTGAVTVNGGTLNLGAYSDTVGTVTLVSGSISGTTGTLTSTGTFEMQYGTVTAKLGGTNIPLNKTTANTVTMSGANTYTGTTTVSAGTLAYGASNAIYTGAVTVNGGTLSLGAYSDTVGTVTLLSGSITGSGTLTGTSYAVESGTISAVLGGGVGLTKSNTGTVTLSGANTYTGGTTVSGGTLALGGNNRLYTGGSITVSGSGVLDPGGYSQSTSGAVSFQGGTVQNGTLSKSGAAYDAQSGTVSAILAGGVGLTKTTAGTLSLSGANTYTGTTTVSAGTLAYGASNAIYTGAVTVNGGTLNLGAYSDTVGTVTLVSGSISGTTGTLTSTGTFEMQYGTVTAKLGGTNIPLNKTTANTVTLSGANTYTGTTTVSAGTLQIGAGSTAGTLGTGGVTNNGALVFNRSNSITVSNVISGTGTLTKQGYGTLTLTGENSYSGTTTINAGVLQIGNGSTTGTLGSGGVTDNGAFGTLMFNRSDSITVSNAISGTILLIKLGAGTLTLTGANDYSGTTTVLAGTLKVGNATAIPGGAGKGNLTVSSVLDLNGYNVTINGLSGSGTITSSVAGDITLTVGGNNQTSSFSGLIEDGEGTVALTKIGTGTQTFAYTQTYTGDTTVTAGTLNVLGNLNSHVIKDGGTVTNTIFYDPHVASAVREALGLDPDAVMTTNDVAQLTSLCLDSNLVFSLQGLEYATNLESLTLVPGDYAADMETLSDLSPLMDLDNLTTLVLQGCGLTDAALATLSSDSVQPDALESLDVRYNSLNSVPVEISDYLPSLTSLYVYGNSAIADAPTTALTNLAGKVVNIDLEPNNPEGAATIADLAEALYYLPIEMYEYVLNTIEYQPYAGAMKGALAVLQTGAGNDWDTAALLAGLFAEAGVSAVLRLRHHYRSRRGGHALPGRTRSILRGSGIGLRRPERLDQRRRHHLLPHLAANHHRLDDLLLRSLLEVPQLPGRVGQHALGDVVRLHHQRRLPR